MGLRLIIEFGFQILMTFSTAAVFSQNLLSFVDFYRDLDKLDPDNLKQVGPGAALLRDRERVKRLYTICTLPY